MITETVIGVFIDVIIWVFQSVMNIVTSPVSGTFGIPAPLLLLVELATGGFLAIYPAVFLWFIWRQIWGK